MVKQIKLLSLIVFLIILSSVSVYSQSELQTALHNFEIEEGEIVYKRVFEAKGMMIEDILNFFKTITNVEINNVSDELFGEIKEMSINYEKYGGKPLNTLIILNYKMNSTLRVQFRNDRYRIILRDIKFYPDENTPALSSEIDFADFMIRRNKEEFNTSKTHTRGLEYMNKHFIDIFTFKELDKEEDW